MTIFCVELQETSVPSPLIQVDDEVEKTEMTKIETNEVGKISD